MIRILTAEEARRTILRRVPPGEVEATPEMLERSRELFGEPLTPHQVVRRILAEVRAEGDAALERYRRLLDGAEDEDLEIPPEGFRAAFEGLSPEMREVLELVRQRLERFHRRQPAGSWLEWEGDGALGQKIEPLGRVGIYAPGGRAAYPSSVLMAGVPARVAGVEELVLATPPQGINQTVLAAAHLAGIRQGFAMGGAQAIAALAYGTQRVPRVDKIVGPGNLFVVLAKQMVYGVVGIEQLPGPTEALIVADETADAQLVAADLAAQAEHDPQATPILITPSRRLAERVAAALEEQLQELDRAEIIRAAVDGQGGIVLVEDLTEALELANGFAPEHLCLLVRDPWAWLGRVRNAGGVFLGQACSESLGDYVIGPSHVMPTGGSARFASPLNVWDFVKITSIFALGPGLSARLTPAAVAMARAEGFSAHSRAMQRRVEPEGRQP